MNRMIHGCALMFLGVAFIGLVGCGSSPPKPGHGTTAKDDHGHGKHGEAGHEKEVPPASYAEGVKKIDEMRVTIKDALAKNDTKTADEPLHEVGETLEHVVGLAEKAGIEGAKLAEIKKAVEQLFDSFGKVDERVHDPKKGATYEEVSQKIDDAMATLRQHVSGDK